jgi:Protein of unknown function (DUF3613).
MNPRRFESLLLLAITLTVSVASWRDAEGRPKGGISMEKPAQELTAPHRETLAARTPSQRNYRSPSIQPSPAARSERPFALGEETQRWLELQRGGKGASEHRQTLSGAVAEAIHKRYVESFKHPVPAFYEGKQKRRAP